MNKLKKSVYNMLPSLLAVIIALIAGSLIMISRGVNPIEAYAVMFKSALDQSSPKFPFKNFSFCNSFNVFSNCCYVCL